MESIRPYTIKSLSDSISKTQSSLCLKYRSVLVSIVENGIVVDDYSKFFNTTEEAQKFFNNPFMGDTK